MTSSAEDVQLVVMVHNSSMDPTCRFHHTTENYLITVSFAVIFALSVVGNSLVIAVIVQQRQMRSITNTYLLNLAISDMMLSAICMPPTLHSVVMSCWMSGDLLCKLFAYLQPMVVTASAYTLAVIAFERYFAICSPLHSRIWQTRSHAYCMISFVWITAIISNLPIGFLYKELPYDDNGGITCGPTEKPAVMFSYQIYMTVVLLLVPLVIMTVLYGRVISTLRSGIRMDIAAVETSLTRENSFGIVVDGSLSRKSSLSNKLSTKLSSSARNSIVTGTSPSNGIRSTHAIKTAVAKQRVIRMLLVIVVIFFCCWTPSYIWWLLLMAGDTFQSFSVWNADVNTFILILTYISSCTNPITYCFMNKKFRTAMLSMFGHKRAIRNHFQKVYLPPNTFLPGNGSSKGVLNRSKSTGCTLRPAVEGDCEGLRKVVRCVTPNLPSGASTEGTQHLSLRLPRRRSSQS